MLATIAPTPYFLLCAHFQMSAMLIFVGLVLLDAPMMPHSRPKQIRILLTCSILIFLSGWLPNTYFDQYWSHEPLFRLSYAPLLGIATVVAVPIKASVWRRILGALLILAGLLVSVMMILNDIFWP